jgi:hypothetical protein
MINKTGSLYGIDPAGYGPRRCAVCGKGRYEDLICDNRIGLATLWVCQECAAEHGLSGPQVNHQPREDGV